MRAFWFTFLILCLSWQCDRCSAEDEFIDPFDMLNYDRATQSMKKPNPMAENRPIHNDRCTVFLSRFVNVLLKSTGLPQTNDGSHKQLKSYASVTISVQDLQLLKDMAAKKDFDYMEIDRILHSMFTPVIKSEFNFKESENFVEIYHQIKDLLFWLSIGSLTIYLLFIVFHNIRRVFSVTFVLFVIFALAFASTWYSMYMKAEINRKVYMDMDHGHSHCKSQKKGWLSFSWFNSHDMDECKRYHEAIYLDPKYSIAVTEVLAEMFSKIMMKPLETLGESIYVFNKSALKDFPVWAQLILVPIIIIIIIKTMFLACALLVGRSLSMKSIFGYGSTTVGPGPLENGRVNASNTINNSTRPLTSAQYKVTQTPDAPNVNFNINLFQPNSAIGYRNTMNETSLSYDKIKKLTSKKKSIKSVAEHLTVECVDGEVCDNDIIKKRRHRTLSI